MKSPFPGMDPYLEQHWGDVHASDQIQDYLPADLRARVEERVLVELPSHDEHTYYPDVRAIERERRGQGATAVVASDVTMAEPLEVPFLEPETQGFIEIVQTHPARKVITVVEVLSPSNKDAGKGRDLYRQKQNDLAQSGISLVEIDLLRAGAHVLQVPLGQYPPEYRTAYKVCVHRSGRAKAEIYRVPLREPLPAIRVPLRPTDADVPLNLQALVIEVYRHGRYTTSITLSRRCLRLIPRMLPGRTSCCGPQVSDWAAATHGANNRHNISSTLRSRSRKSHAVSHCVLTERRP